MIIAIVQCQHVKIDTQRGREIRHQKFLFLTMKMGDESFKITFSSSKL